MTIVKRNGKYFVLSKDGSKKLGGPFNTRGEAVKRLQQVEAFKAKESLSWDVQEFKVEESHTQSGTKWLKMSGVAITEGKSKNNRVYRFQNLQENNGKSFNFIVGHQDDYDNPKHNVGEGTFQHQGNNLRFDSKIRNTLEHPDIVEKVSDGLVAPSVQGGFDKVTKQITESGQTEILMEGLSLPLIALVNKHTRGVEGAAIETAIAERLDMNDMENEGNSKINIAEAKMEEEIKTQITELAASFSKLQESFDKQVKEANDKKKLDEELKKKKEEEALKKLEDDKKKTAESIVSINPELKQDDLVGKSIEELKVIESYEKKLKESGSKGAAEVTDEVKETASDEQLKGIVFESQKGEIKMNDSRYEQFNKDLRESIYR